MDKKITAPYKAESHEPDTTKVVFLDFNVCDQMLEHYKAQLTDDEQQRVNGIKIDVRRKQYIITRAVTRQIIADATCCKKSTIEFKLHKHGKPYCSYPKNSLFFNLSHSLTVGTIAINPDYEIGIDVQQHRPQKNILNLAKRFFAKTEIEILETTTQENLNNVFFRIWVRKEALLKATGKGLAQGLSHYTVVNDGLMKDQCIVNCDNTDYFISDIPAPQDYSSAIATKNTDCKFKVTQWQHPR